MHAIATPCDFDERLSGSWSEFMSKLNDNFSLSEIVKIASEDGYNIGNEAWSDYFTKHCATRTKIRMALPGNDNDIWELTEVELDSVSGGAPVATVAVIVLGAAVHVAVAAYATVVGGVYAAVVAFTAVAASNYVYSVNYVWTVS